MQYPLARVPAATRGRLQSASLVATLGIWVVLLYAGAPLNTPQAPRGIISFELAGTLERAREIIDSWGSAQLMTASFGLGLDYLFMLAYSTFFALACLSAGEAAREIGSRLATLAVPLAWGQWVAAGLDATENLALFSLLMGSAWEAWPPVAWFCASVKFALIGTALIYTIWGAGLRTLEDFLNRSL